MNVQYLFDSSGNWIAFRKETNLFDQNGNWIGWIPWGDSDVITPDGDYLGTICDHDRLYRFPNRPYRGYPGFPGFPSYPGYPGYPGFAGYSPLPPEAHDVAIS